MKIGVLFCIAFFEWDPSEMDEEEEIRVHTFTLDEALWVTKDDYRYDPEAGLAPGPYVGYDMFRI